MATSPDLPGGGCCRVGRTARGAASWSGDALLVWHHRPAQGIKPALPDRQVDEPGDTMTTMNATVWGVTAETVYLSPAPVYHAAPLRTCTAVQALGGTVVVMDRFETLPFEYHNASEKTSGAQHPAHPTWTTTGDVGYLDEDGYLFLTDRDSFKIISGGVNIYPQEIENALVEHPKVLDACVIGLPDNEMGEIGTAVIVPGTEVDGDDALATELLDYLRERIAKYKLPRRIEFTHDLPRTPTGKLAKRTLKERFANTSVR